MVEPFDVLECLEDMKTCRMVVGDPNEYLEDYHAKIDKIKATIAADRKRIEELEKLKEDARMELKERSAKIVGLGVLMRRRADIIAAQAATIGRLRGEMEKVRDVIGCGIHDEDGNLKLQCTIATTELDNCYEWLDDALDGKEEK